ncbi:hypothetical protein DPMN_065442 [Dreissena polymorpha]|uniref:Uncharacterized protein n=1 Tax=Dreissena polymorpha TaxID=45954 RepID=A0A9D3YS77_DREPO|nr:hypothetical protein DPMN_065442 [Dreissena polymorpha]
MGRFEEAVRYHFVSLKRRKTVLSFSDVIKQRPKSYLWTECYECLAEVYDAVGDDAKVRDKFTKIKTELLRLEYLYTCDCNEPQAGKIRQQLADIECKLKALPHSNDEVTNTQCESD